MALKGIATGNTGVAGVWSTYILRKFVPMLASNKIFADYAEPAQLPRGAGAYVARWNLPLVYNAGSFNSTLTEISATDGEISNTTITFVEQTMHQCGRWMKVSDLAEATELTGTLDIYAEQFAEDAADQVDREIMAQCALGTNFLHAQDVDTGGATLLTTSTNTAQDFVAIAGFFHGTNAKGWQNLRGDYVWIMHPNQEVDIATHVTTDALSWSDVNKHVPEGYEKLVDVHNSVGRLGGVWAHRTTIIGTVTEDVAAYRSFAIARYGVGWLGLNDSGGAKTPKVKIKRPGPSDTSQPLDMYMTIGWKYNAVAKLLDSNRVLTVYSAV